MRQFKLVVLVGCSITLYARNALAWGDEGHEIVGLIADHYLAPTVRSKVNAILGTDTTHLTTDTSIASETTWADKFRDSDRNTTKVHYNQTHNWHFADIEIQGGSLASACFGFPALPPGTAASMGPADDCVVDKVNEFAAELKSPSTSPDEKRMALQFLLHFVGDIHQPLHASDDNDRGGNNKRVSAAGLKANNLHHYWDTEFVHKLGSDPSQVAQALIANITPGKLASWRKKTPSDWALQSNALANSNAYGKLPPPNAKGSYRLTNAYIQSASTTVATQLSRAGVRLAELLNESLK